MNTLFDQHPLARFADFNERHPEVYRLFVRLADEMRRAGRERYSARTIGERIRWEYDVGDKGGSPKLNDHLWPWMARKLAAERPEFSGFFEFRESKA